MIRRGYVDVAGGQLHYRYRPGRGAPVVCLHQTASSSAMFERVMDRWQGPEALYALDTPGFGGSYEPDGEPTMADYGAVLLEATRALGLGRMHLFGHHTGACIAIEMADAAPERIASLSMIGPVTITREEASAFKSVYPKDFRIRADGSHLRRMWDYVAEIGGASSVDLHHREFVDTARAWAGHIRVYRAIWDQDFVALYRRVRAPLLIMCSPDDVLWPIFPRAKELRPDAQAVELGGSNFQTDEVPDQVVAALRGFLDRVPA
jgi:pimeloyl-ACP methyl ester carboxylesterase